MYHLKIKVDTYYKITDCLEPISFGCIESCLCCNFTLVWMYVPTNTHYNSLLQHVKI